MTAMWSFMDCYNKATVSERRSMEVKNLVKVVGSNAFSEAEDDYYFLMYRID